MSVDIEDVTGDYDTAAGWGWWPPTGRATSPTCRPSCRRTATARSPSSTPTPTAWRGPGAGAGVVPGDAVALMVSNRPEFAEVVAATQRAGLRVTPINWHLTADEAAYIVGDCQARVFVADARFAEVARGRAPSARRRPPCAWRSAAPIDGFEPYDEALAAEDGSDIDDPQLGRSMLYTSGTTGPAQGRAPRRGAADVGHRRAVRLHGRAVAAPVHGPAVPRRPAGVLARRSRSTPGAAVVLMDRWSPEETLRLIAEHGITHSHLVPTMFHRLLRLPDEVRAAADVSSLADGAARRRALPGGGQAGDHRLVGPGAGRVLRGHRGHGHVRHQPRVARATGHGRQAADPRPRPHPRPRVGRAPAGRRGRHGVPEGAAGRAVRLLRRPRQDRRQLPGRPLHDGRRRLPRRGRATCSSPTAAPT